MNIDQQPPKKRSGRFAALRYNFLTGLIIIAPIGLTAWLIWAVIGWIDGVVLPLVPDAYQPDIWIQRLLGLEMEQMVAVRGIGVVVFILFTLLVGWVGKGLMGRTFIAWGETMVERLPVVRSIYNGVKQIAETILAQQENSFEKACIIEYPRKGIWAIGFISTDAKGEIARHNPSGDDLVSVFLPTTPNPTSGFLLFVPKRDVTVLDMSVEDAAKLVISAGLVYPSNGTLAPRSDVPPRR